jgi:hypothetical protein
VGRRRRGGAVSFPGRSQTARFQRIGRIKAPGYGIESECLINRFALEDRQRSQTR